MSFRKYDTFSDEKNRGEEGRVLVGSWVPGVRVAIRIKSKR